MAEAGLQTLLLLGRGRRAPNTLAPTGGQGPFALPGDGQAWVVPSAVVAGVTALAGVTAAAPVAIHSGLGHVDARGVYGPAVDRLTALLAVAQPGQILLSRAGAAALRGALPAGTTLRDLGERRLRDLLAREKLYQLDSPDRPTMFPPLPTLDELPNNLPPQMYPLIGRTLEVPALTARLRDPAVRMLTLTGTPGIGKTRLALQVAAEAVPQFAGGAWFVALAMVHEVARVPQAIAQAMALRETGGGLLLASLIATLSAQPTLLVLDTLEQVPEIADLIRDLLAEAPQLKVLATSREALHLAGEERFNVPPLGLPALQLGLSLAELSRVEAVAVFVARATEVNPRFVLTAANAPDVAAICRLLDGLPLAIELAAARTAQWPPGPLLARLRGGAGHTALRVLTGGAPHLPARQQTLRGAIGWSYALLAPAEADLFADVAVFRGSFTAEAVLAVTATPADQQVVVGGRLDSLVEKSLLRYTDGPSTAPRYQMLETIREYAAERLADRSDAALLRARHAAYYLEVALAAALTWTTPDHAAWLPRLDADNDNLRVALAWGCSPEGDSRVGVQLAVALSAFWNLRGYLSEGEQWLTAYLALSDLAPDLRLRARNELGRLLWTHGDLDRARIFYGETLRLAEELGDVAATGLALNQLGNVAYVQGAYTQAHTFYTDSIRLRRQAGDQAAIASSLNNLGLVAMVQQQFDQARIYLEESLDLQRRRGDAHGMAFAFGNLADVYIRLGDYAGGQVLIEECLVLRRQVGDRPGVAGVLGDLGEVARLQGDYATAARLGAESLALCRQLGTPLSTGTTLLLLARTALAHTQPQLAGPLFAEALRLFQAQYRAPDIADCLRGLALVAGASDDAGRAAQLSGAAGALLHDLGLTAPDPHQAADVQALAALQARSDTESWATAAAIGAALPLDAVVALALAPLSSLDPT